MLIVDLDLELALYVIREVTAITMPYMFHVSTPRSIELLGALLLNLFHDLVRKLGGAFAIETVVAHGFFKAQLRLYRHIS